MKYVKSIPSTIKTKMKSTLIAFPLTFRKQPYSLSGSLGIPLQGAEMTGVPVLRFTVYRNVL